MGRNLSGQRDCQRHSGSRAASLPHHQHQGRKLPVEGQAEGGRVGATAGRTGGRWRMIPMRRLRLKHSTGWFAAGEEMAAALAILSDAAFKLYVWLCLNVNRHSGRMVWEAIELAHHLQCDRHSVNLALEELCRRQVCVQRPTADGALAKDRLSIEICDRFWPYEKMPVRRWASASAAGERL